MTRAQEPVFSQGLMSKADSLHNNYSFNEAITIYNDALKSDLDSISKIQIANKLLLSENGLNMMEFCYTPIVVAKQTFSIDDFYLYYPLEDRSWRKIPNQLDSTKVEDIVKATYAPQGNELLYYSSCDSDGVRNLYKIQYKDSVWAQPQLVNEDLISAFNEAYPLLSADKKTMYFSSIGLYGVGGYDLYKSTWNENIGDWGVPTNLGFPFSSPANDFLFYNTTDGKYSLFASDRDCPKDSINVYVIEFESTPIHQSVTESELKEVMNLAPENDLTRVENNISTSIPENVNVKKYSAKVKEIKEIRDSVALYVSELDIKRTRYATIDDPDERAQLTTQILSMESELPNLQSRLNKSLSELQEIEMQFLFSGIAIDTQSLIEEADREVVGASTSYTFSKLALGDPLSLNIEKPVEEFDYTFMILPEARFAENNELPSGLVYQIQVMASSKKASLKQLKGLSPIFEARANSGVYLYKVGLFRAYQDVLANLNKVKRLGFRSAFIVATNNGKSMTITNARALEKTKRYNYQVNIYYNEESLPTVAMTAISQMTDSDIKKVIKSGSNVYTVGPLVTIEDAQKIEAIIKSVGLLDISIEKIEISNN